MGMAHGTVWRDLELGAPEIARLGLARLHAPHVALLGTLRRDGSPRISPIETYLVEGQLLVGAMSWSRKSDDLRRDPRYVLHSAITDPDAGEGEFKVYGVAALAGKALRDAAADAWWLARPSDKAIVFALHIDLAVFIDWDLQRGQLTMHRWSNRSGYEQRHRSYP
jgi:hypothetical protein